jgi:hypothetical protein
VTRPFEGDSSGRLCGLRGLNAGGGAGADGDLLGGSSTGNALTTTNRLRNGYCGAERAPDHLIAQVAAHHAIPFAVDIGMEQVVGSIPVRSPKQTPKNE